MCYNYSMIKKLIRENYIYLIIISVLIILFTIIMRSSLLDKIIIIDNQVIDFMKLIVNKYLTFIFKIFTFIGDFYIPVFIIVCCFFLFKNKWYSVLLSCGYLFSGFMSFFCKYLSLRPRPIDALISIPKSYSFPSGHTLTSVVFYFLLWYLLTINSTKKVKTMSLIVTIICITLIAISRMYLGVHYFSDVVGGYIIGLFCLSIIINIINLNFKEKLK